METNRLEIFKEQLEQYQEEFIITNDDNLITATSTKFIEPTIEEKKLDLIKFYQQMLKNNNIQLMNKFKETKRNEIKKYKESHRKKEFNKPITPYQQEILNTLKNPDNGFNLALTLNFNPVNLSGLFNLQMVQNKVNEWWKLYCSYTLGRDGSKYKAMNYIGFVEHVESNKLFQQQCAIASLEEAKKNTQLAEKNTKIAEENNEICKSALSKSIIANRLSFISIVIAIVSLVFAICK